MDTSPDASINLSHISFDQDHPTCSYTQSTQVLTVTDTLGRTVNITVVAVTPPFTLKAAADGSTLIFGS
jgi:hypothetical protein